MAHYYSENQDSPLKIEVTNVTLLGNDLSFQTAGGVFSKGRIDKGSYILINHAIVKDNDRLLDLGCGYGVVGISFARDKEIELVMTDINKRAIMLTRRNIKTNNVDAKILQGDGFEKVEGKFDTILLNPPQHAGKKLCFYLIEESKNYLKNKGTLQIVARHNKGGKHLSEHMESVFGNIETVTKKSGFRVYLSSNIE